MTQCPTYKIVIQGLRQTGVLVIILPVANIVCSSHALLVYTV